MTKILYQVVHLLTICAMLLTCIFIVSTPMQAYGDTTASPTPLTLQTADLNATNIHLDLSNPNRPELICASAAFSGLTLAFQTAAGTETMETNANFPATGVSIVAASTDTLTGMLSSFVSQTDMDTLLHGGTLTNVDMKNVQWNIQQFLTTGQFSIPNLMMSSLKYAGIFSQRSCSLHVFSPRAANSSIL